MRAWETHARATRYWAKGFSDGMQAIGAGPGEFFILSRNAWSRTAAHGAALWSGDVSSNWPTLAAAVAAGQGAAMSGIPLWTTDIGGWVLRRLRCYSPRLCACVGLLHVTAVSRVAGFRLRACVRGYSWFASACTPCCVGRVTACVRCNL